MKVTPYSPEGSKREQVERMFDNISPRYDLLNRLFSMGVDQGWRRKVMRMVTQEPVEHLLDVATGTADLAILASRHVPKVTGVDISEGMLRHGRVKVEKRGLAGRVELMRADSAELPFEDGRFDAVTVAFGVRNFEELATGITEMRRVLKPNGRLFVLEFSKPANSLLGRLFRFYFHRVMPFVGRMISKDKAAYTYLPRSVDAFPEGEAFLRIMADAGLQGTSAKALTGGIATLYVGRR